MNSMADYTSFSDRASAINHRAQTGGWIFSVEGSSEHICFSPRFTPTAIFTHHATKGLSGSLL
jgi:hypothetical protein